MYSVTLLGTGNVAQHLFEAFNAAPQLKVVQVYGRNPDNLKKFERYTDISSDSCNIKDADIYVIAVKDDAIPEVAKLLVSKKGIVVHTSGAMGMDCIPAANRGVFYPLQTFTEGKSLNLRDIPVCIEVNQNSSTGVLRAIAEQISDNVCEINSEQRKKLHLAAVYVNNFTNYLYQIGEDICKKAGLPFSLLRPLVLETAQKVQMMSPMEAQTGPAKRGDIKSIQSHLKLLESKKQTEIYSLLSEAIRKEHEEKL